MTLLLNKRQYLQKEKKVNDTDSTSENDTDVSPQKDAREQSEHQHAEPINLRNSFITAIELKNIIRGVKSLT